MAPRDLSFERGNRLAFIDKKSMYYLPLFILFMGSVLLLLAELYDYASVNPTPLFAAFKVLFSYGFAMTIAGMFLENSSFMPIDVYSKGPNYVLFKNHSLVSLAKMTLLLLGIVCSYFGLQLEPETVNEQKDGGYYLSLILGGLITLSILAQSIISIRNLLMNRGDFIYLSAQCIRWYDNDFQCTKELAVSEVSSYSTKYEDTDKSPSLEEIHLHLLNGKVEVISLKLMSLIPHEKIIQEELKKLGLEKQKG
jgi:hypothetical protein